MKFQRIKNIDSNEFKEAWKIYESSFPPDERRTLELQKKIIINPQYSFLIVTKSNVLSAFITNWNLGDFLFVEHLAVRADLRGKGIGTELLKKYLSQNKQKIVLEVEKPENEIAVKRIKFYERLGFNLNHFGYLQPSLGEGKNPVPLLLMTYPIKITAAKFSLIREKIHLIAYGLKKPFLKLLN